MPLSSATQGPAFVGDRAVLGNWDVDLIVGSKNNSIVMLVECHSRFVILAKASNKDTQSVLTALIKQSHKLPKELYRSLTWDRGSEMTAHQKFTLATDINVYYCDLQSPLQRGSNESTNRLLRQYFPKGIDLSDFSQAKLSSVARPLNERPRKTLQYQTPAKKFNECIASMG
jgi:IS30 family transposase